MADCVVNLAEESQITTPGLQEAVTGESQASLDVLSSPSADTSFSPFDPLLLPTAHRWYFQESETEESAKKLNLILDEQQQSPVKIDASRKTTTWNISLPSSHEEGAFYDVVLGVSVQDLDIDCIESILFRFDQLEASNEGLENEAIRADELKRLSSMDGLDNNKNKGNQGQDARVEGNVFLWKLFFRCYGKEGGVTITMVVNTWTDLPHRYGSLDLHFVELCPDSPLLYRADALYREHCPYASWLVDFNRSGCPEYDAMTDKMRIFSNYSLSGDGRFAALKTTVGEKKYLEVWSLEDRDAVANHLVVPKEDTDSQDDSDDAISEQSKVKPHRATPVAWMPLSDKDHDISISWDGSLLALVDRTPPSTDADKNDDSTTTHQSEFAIFQCSRDDTNASEKSSSRMSLVRYDVQQTCPGLRNYIGNGVFHMVDKSCPDSKDELFITCNGVTIDVYSTFEAWTPLRSIVMDSSVTSMDHAPDIGEVLFNRTRGRYLITGNSHTAFTFDIVQGTLLSFTSALLQEDLRVMSYFSGVSEDGSLIAIPGFRQVNVYRTRTWTLHGSYVFHEIASDERLLSVTFLCGDSLLLVTTVPVENLLAQTRPGYVLDVVTMSVVDRTVPDGHAAVRLAPLNGSDQGLAYAGFSQLWNMRLEDRTYQHGQRYPDRCTDLCRSPDRRDLGVQEGTSSSGLRFKAQKSDAATGSYLKRDKRSSLMVTMTAMDGSQVKKMAIPLPNGDSIRSAAFFSDFKYLLVVTGLAYMAWTVPTTFDGDFCLQLVLFAPYTHDWMVCPHGFIRCRFEEEDEEFKFVDHLMHLVSDQVPVDAFVAGVGAMMYVYDLADPGMRQDILRYFNKYLNRTFDGQTHLLEFLTYYWSPEHHQVFCDFLRDLLAFPGTRWVPPQDMLISANPLANLLETAKTQPLANAPVQIIVDYCLRQAKAEQDPQFLLPIQQCFHLLVDPKGQYSEVALNIYREMAFFPARGRDFIIEHHALSNPLTFRWRFWKPYPWGLHQYKDQVMQLETVKIPSPPKGNFTREIFQASFDILWRKPEAKESQDESEEESKSAHVRKLFSWPKAIWTMVLRKCKLTYNSTIECYPFELEALDNPALMALVEYKWNTIGFNYWLVRFVGQLCYYILVLTAVFLQIYGENGVTDEGALISDPGPEGLYIAIIVIAFTYLWLELVQLMKDKRGYLQSVYNLVDFCVFLLPLAGAINQILIIHGVIQAGLNPGILSFSVLLVFLHFLFELRVFQVVCHFVSIIIRAIYSIRVFIFVFSGGLLAFAIAILHLLHACVNAEQCAYFTEGFSNNLLRAISGGNYDPVETGFTSDSFAFHAMMMVFFFFTVIVMLNVLIALINNAINDGDQTWQLDWLEYRMRYVESAENMTYDIPGFRENHNYFPDTIYYTGTPQQVRDYEKKTKQMMEGVSSTDTTIVPITMAATSVSVVASKASEKINEARRVDDTADTKVVLLVETELRKQLDSERVKSEKQISELQQQLKDQQQMLREQQQMLTQILGKLER